MVSPTIYDLLTHYPVLTSIAVHLSTLDLYRLSITSHVTYAIVNSTPNPVNAIHRLTQCTSQARSRINLNILSTQGLLRTYPGQHPPPLLSRHPLCAQNSAFRCSSCATPVCRACKPVLQHEVRGGFEFLNNEGKKEKQAERHTVKWELPLAFGGGDHLMYARAVEWKGPLVKEWRRRHYCGGCGVPGMKRGSAKGLGERGEIAAGGDDDDGRRHDVAEQMRFPDGPVPRSGGNATQVNLPSAPASSCASHAASSTTPTSSTRNLKPGPQSHKAFQSSLVTPTAKRTGKATITKRKHLRHPGNQHLQARHPCSCDSLPYSAIINRFLAPRELCWDCGVQAWQQDHHANPKPNEKTFAKGTKDPITGKYKKGAMVGYKRYCSGPQCDTRVFRDTCTSICAWCDGFMENDSLDFGSPELRKSRKRGRTIESAFRPGNGCEASVIITPTPRRTRKRKVEAADNTSCDEFLLRVGKRRCVQV